MDDGLVIETKEEVFEMNNVSWNVTMDRPTNLAVQSIHCCP